MFLRKAGVSEWHCSQVFSTARSLKLFNHRSTSHSTDGYSSGNHVISKNNSRLTLLLHYVISTFEKKVTNYTRKTKKSERIGHTLSCTAETIIICLHNFIQSKRADLLGKRGTLLGSQQISALQRSEPATFILAAKILKGIVHQK